MPEEVVTSTVTSSSESAGRAPRKRSSGVVVPHVARWYQRLGAWVLYALLQLISFTMRYRWQSAESRGSGKAFFRAALEQEEMLAIPAIYCTWHNRLALCLPAYYRYNRGVGRRAKLAAMVSASRDGAFLASALEWFGVQPVRGSSSRRGAQALLELVSWAERGYDLAITPDGPRGPCYVVQEGVISLAQVTGLPLIPFNYNVHWKWRLKSWDRFIIPLPFSVCDMMVGQVLHVPRHASPQERKELRARLEKSLRELTRD